MLKITVACNTDTVDTRYNNTVTIRDPVDQSTWQVTGTQTHCRVPGGCTNDDRHLFVISEPCRLLFLLLLFFVVAFVAIFSSLSYLHCFCILLRLVKSWFATISMARGFTLLVPLIRMGSSGLEHQSLYSLMGEYVFIDALGLSFICVVGNTEISVPRNTAHVCCAA
jgi:hypothetical protein